MMLPVRSVLLFLFISTSAVMQGVRAAQDGSYQEEVQQRWQGHQHTCAHGKVQNFEHVGVVPYVMQTVRSLLQVAHYTGYSTMSIITTVV